MLAANGHHWFDRRTPDSGWSSFLVSVLLTLALFSAAFVAMRTVPGWVAPRTDREPPVVVRLERPAPSVTQRKPIPKTTTAPVRPAPVVPPVVQPTTPIPPAAPPIVATPPAAPPGPERTDTSGAAPSTSAGRGAVAVPRGGAPMAPSGVTSEQMWRATAQFRDSSKTIHVGDVPLGAWTREATGKEKAEIEERQRAAAMVARRATTAGAANDVVILRGKGMDGDGAVSSSNSGSVPFPLFSNGPSAAQRKKDAAIDADNRARLKRLQERIKQKRDSILADSIARAKGRIVPG